MTQMRTGSILGNAVPRVEDPDLVVGAGDYVDDLRVDGTLQAIFVRSPFAHARITRVDTGEAEASPGVVAVYTAESLGSEPVPPFAVVNKACARPALTGDAARYVGDPVALVVAETRAQAMDAAELVDVDYDELPVVADMEAALADDAPLQFPDLGSNVAAAVRDPDDSDPLDGADVVVRLRMENQRVAVAPIEGHAILVEPKGDRVVLHLATQHPHMARDLMAKYTGLDKSDVQVVVPHVEIGRAHVLTPVTVSHLVCRLLLEKKKFIVSVMLTEFDLPPQNSMQSYTPNLLFGYFVCNCFMIDVTYCIMYFSLTI